MQNAEIGRGTAEELRQVLTVTLACCWCEGDETRSTESGYRGTLSEFKNFLHV